MDFFDFMNVLVLGDVVAKPGRRAVLDNISKLRHKYQADAALMNAENVAGGFSITPEIAEELFGAGRERGGTCERGHGGGAGAGGFQGWRVDRWGDGGCVFDSAGEADLIAAG